MPTTTKWFTASQWIDPEIPSSNDGSGNTSTDTLIDTTTGTYFLLLRATKGTGGESVANSVVDFWFNPTDASSVGALGAADWSTGADSKWGRNSQTMSGITGTLSSAGSADEIRLGTTLADVTAIPEPSATLLGGLGLLLLRRRR